MSGPTTEPDVTAQEIGRLRAEARASFDRQSAALGRRTPDQFLEQLRDGDIGHPMLESDLRRCPAVAGRWPTRLGDSLTFLVVAHGLQCTVWMDRASGLSWPKPPTSLGLERRVHAINDQQASELSVMLSGCERGDFENVPTKVYGNTVCSLLIRSANCEVDVSACTVASDGGLTTRLVRLLSHVLE